MNKSDKLTIRFHEFELEHVNAKDWEIWEACRFDIYYKIRDQLDGIKTSLPHNNTPVRKTVKDIINTTGKLFKFIYYSLKNRHGNLMFSMSRFQDDKGVFYDPALNDIYESFKEKSFVIETAGDRNKRKYPGSSNPLLTIYSKLKKRTESFPIDLLNELNSHFKVHLNKGNLDDITRRYFNSKDFYLKFFKFFKPESVFISQNGPQKGIFRAANQLKIPIFELQHGIVYFSHLFYSFPKGINPKQLAIPDYFLTYSEFWKGKVEGYFPVKEIIVTGNTEASKSIQADEIYDLCFICCNAFMPIFIPFIGELYKHGYKGKICLKLHPQQSGQVDTLREIYKNNSLVEVLFVEKSMKEVIGLSKNFVTIQSTSAYEVLDAGKNLYLLKTLSYDVHDDIFDDERVCLIENPEDLLSFINKRNKVVEGKKICRFFEPFKTDSLNEIKKRIQGGML